MHNQRRNLHRFHLARPQHAVRAQRRHVLSDDAAGVLSIQAPCARVGAPAGLPAHSSWSPCLLLRTQVLRGEAERLRERGSDNEQWSRVRLSCGQWCRRSGPSVPQSADVLAPAPFKLTPTNATLLAAAWSPYPPRSVRPARRPTLAS
jgi:hypothetical protein